MAITLGTDLEAYVLLEELSQNDRFTLYSGHRQEDNTAVLIKIVNPLFSRDEYFVRRFKQIYKQIAKLEHPNILRTDEAIHTADLLGVAQDYVEAQTLTQAIEVEGPFSPQRMQLIVEQIASALDYAHQKTVLHGDLSAHQIYLGPGDHVLISGFGETQAFCGTNLTRNTYVINSPETLAPERVHGQGPSRPADLYALGIICYHMLAKKPPFTGPTSAVLQAQAHRQPRSLYQVNGRIPVGMGKAVGRMLSKGVELRYNTGAEFTRALEMAHHDKKSFDQFTHLAPVSERVHHQPLSFKTFFYISTGLMLTMFVAVLFAWAGYELGLKKTSAQAPPPELVVTTTISSLRRSEDTLQIAPTEAVSETEPVSATAKPAATPMSSTASSLLPLPTALTNRRQPTVAPVSITKTPPVAIAPPTPASNIPLGKSLFVFFNPTGHDLVVDLTGPTSISNLVPPHQRQEFVLEPGPYQYMVHTPTGEWLSPVVSDFDLPPGHQVEKDYYSDYDWTKQ
jgi:serine/threonine protein kinase